MTTILRPGTRVHMIPGIGVSTSRRVVSVAAAGGWWTTNGTPAPVAAWQGIGVASYAASKLNLDNPGIGDLVDGDNGAVAWSTATGWTFQRAWPWTYFYTGIAYDTTDITILIRVANAAEYAIIGTEATGTLLMRCQEAMPYKWWMFANGGSNLDLYNQGYNSGVMGISGNKAYRNGGLLGTIPGGTPSGGNILISGQWKNVAHYSGDALAAAVWKPAITETQLIAVSAAMAAL